MRLTSKQSDGLSWLGNQNYEPMKNFTAFIILLILLACNNNKNNQALEPQPKDQNYILNQKDSLAIQLIQLYGSDQIARHQNRLISALDTINFKVLVDFVRQHGFPNKALLGKHYMAIEEVQAAAGAVLLHNPHRLVNEQQYFDLFLNEVHNGNMSKEYLALILDKYYWVRRDKDGHRMLLYGTQFGMPCLKYKTQSDSARLAIGLKPLADSLFLKCF